MTIAVDVALRATLATTCPVSTAKLFMSSATTIAVDEAPHPVVSSRIAANNVSTLRRASRTLRSGVDWRTGLTFWADGVLTAFRRHPWYSKVPVRRPVRTTSPGSTPRSGC